MEIISPDNLNTSAECAEAFCSMTARTLTFLARKVTDTNALVIIDELRRKFIIVRDTVLTREEIIKRAGAVLFKWRDHIQDYDEDFFLKTDIGNLINDALEQCDSKSSINITDESRSVLGKSLDASVRNAIFNALNAMIIMYARFIKYKSHAM